MLKAVLFALVGLVFFAHWLSTDPSFGGTASQSEWKLVVFFSAAILTVCFAVRGLVGLTAAIMFGVRGRLRLLAVIPLGTILAIALYVFARGPLMLVTWFAAATFALVLPKRAPATP